jgi:hypothetical protein
MSDSINLNSGESDSGPNTSGVKPDQMRIENAFLQNNESTAAINIYHELIDRLIVHYTGAGFATEVLDAKREFFDEAGVMDEENIFFEMRVTQFLEWYLFSRPMIANLLTPSQSALTEKIFEKSQSEFIQFQNLSKIKHSLFEFQKIRGDDVFIKDLFTGEKIVIQKSPIQIGFSREEIFDARLIPDGDQYQFTRAFAFHPAEATDYILDEVKKVQRADFVLQDILMLRLLKMRYKYEQYRHLKLEHVYTNERKVRF